jgi:hypothetical protein
VANDPDQIIADQIIERLLQRMVAAGQISLAMRITKAARLLDISKSKLYDAAKRGELRTLVIAGQQRVSLDELMRLVLPERRDNQTSGGDQEK